MKRLCIFFNVRGGSSFTRALLAKSYSLNKDSLNSCMEREPFLLPTNPPVKHYFEDSIPGKHIIEDYVMKTLKVTHPEIYTHYVPFGANSTYLNRFPGDKNQWRFAYILRDQRDRIESYLNWGEIKNKDIEEQNNAIIGMCKTYKKTVIGIKEMLDDQRFQIFRFEQYIIDPVKTLEDMFSMIDVSIIDKSFFLKRVKEISPNSSFKDDGKKSNRRWSCWNKSRKDLVKSYISQELIDLDYEKDDKW